MKDKNTNLVTVNGYVYSFGNEKTGLAERVSKKGAKYIGGDLLIAIDPECTNVISIHFNYVGEVFPNKGTVNPTYGVLASLLANGVTAQSVRAENGDITTVPYVSVRGSIGTNDYIGTDGQRHEPKRIEGGSVTRTNPTSRPMQATFKADMLVERVTRKEATEDNGWTDDRLEIAGCLWTFRNEMVPVVLDCRTPENFEVFEHVIGDDLPYVSSIDGIIRNVSTVRQVVEQGAGTMVRVSTQRDYDRCWEVVYIGQVNDYGSVVTEEDVVAARQAREVHWSEIEANRKEYMESQAQKAAPVAKSALDTVRDAAKSAALSKVDF